MKSLGHGGKKIKENKIETKLLKQLGGYHFLSSLFLLTIKGKLEISYLRVWLQARPLVSGVGLVCTCWDCHHSREILLQLQTRSVPDHLRCLPKTPNFFSLWPLQAKRL